MYIISIDREEVITTQTSSVSYSRCVTTDLIDPYNEVSDASYVGISLSFHEPLDITIISRSGPRGSSSAGIVMFRSWVITRYSQDPKMLVRASGRGYSSLTFV